MECINSALLNLVRMVSLLRVLVENGQFANPGHCWMVLEAERLVVAEVLLLCAAKDGECSCTCGTVHSTGV